MNEKPKNHGPKVFGAKDYRPGANKSLYSLASAVNLSALWHYKTMQGSADDQKDFVQVIRPLLLLAFRRGLWGSELAGYQEQIDECTRTANVKWSFKGGHKEEEAQ